jgi:tripartite-type tricarboxylate transporter receptor subunit TctC
MADFLALAKRSEKPLTYSSSGLGSMGHLVGELFGQKANIKIEHVPYRGASQGLVDLVGGHIVFGSQTVSSTASYIRSGALVPIGVSSPERMPDYPDVPTFKELGYPDVVSTIWFGLSGPPGLPKEIVERMNREVIRAMSSPEVQQRLRQDGSLAMPMTTAEFNKVIDEETVRWKPVVERAGLAAK